VEVLKPKEPAVTNQSAGPVPEGQAKA
jgi:hypothetical protein